jgi:glucosamine-phosphate N-acetyltransferase
MKVQPWGLGHQGAAPAPICCRLVEELLLVAQQQGCYKAILDCAESNAGFYEKCGMQRKEVQMVKYFDR